jgi:cyclopropane-fatty-acyl-phospholipid synthase
VKASIHALFTTLGTHFPDLSFVVRFWDGEQRQYGDGAPSFTLHFRTSSAARHLLSSGTLGFGEEYMNGAIDVEGDFAQLVRLSTDPHVDDLSLSFWTKLLLAVRSLFFLNTVKRSTTNVSHHYNRGNEFYELYLDKSLTYSCAYFRSPEDTLEQAQERKYEHLCRKLLVKPGESLIDVGCGWGGMLLYAAQRFGAIATGCTLSVPQFEYATAAVTQKGMKERISVLLQDYRNLSGTFDKFVSIGMFEHVGKKLIPTFMEKTYALLKPGGIGVLHTIGKDRAGTMDPWTLKYIFPGGYVPGLHETLRAMADAGLIVVDVENMRLHYALTLDEWSRRFERNVDRVRALFDERFVRMWRLFLAGSAAGFRWGNSRLYQITFTRGLNNGLPLTRSSLYA